MKKINKVVGVLLMSSVALGVAAEKSDLGLVTNINSAVERVNASNVWGLKLSEREMNQLDQVTSSAAARAVLALHCQASPGEFENVSRRIEQVLEAKVVLISDDTKAARAYARDSAATKYKAMALANQGLRCNELDRLREIASVQGFDE